MPRAQPLPPAIEVNGVTKTFKDLRALDGASLRIETGEIYGLLGPNGAGKSTLIRTLAGLLTADSGTVKVLGHTMPDLAALDQIGYMTQQPALYPDLSVEENVRFFAALYGREDDGVQAALELVDLASRRQSIVATLSGGMRTRCSLACAVVHKPRLLVLDEPTVGIDPQLRAEIWGKLGEMAADGVTVVVSSHVMDEAERCQRLCLMRAGRILAEGTVAELKKLAGVKRLEDAFLRLSAEPAA
ncbi:MAG TPA: ABC transporter ATP-binding protein [Candidatus Solibacter sp.]|jgi:ABC-2 type transport system ATP-binding protein|nr:ABC transporter ATP-binding protein [Candidatus Solibacter sp.]